MDPFSSPPLSGSAEGPSNEVVMDKVKQQLAQAYAEEFFSVRNLCPTISLNIACLLSSLSLSLSFSHVVSHVGAIPVIS